VNVGWWLDLMDGWESARLERMVKATTRLPVKLNVVTTPMQAQAQAYGISVPEWWRWDLTPADHVPTYWPK
jgi:hypothetical protein